MKKINWLANIGAVSAFNIIGWLMIYFDERITVSQGATILGVASVFIMLYAIVVDLSREDV